ncbi:MAG: hypothetical protein IT166_07025 [Bryobacterales bacterium]|nr:hypothetical protein [Bryobacterales bacterium]
MILSTPPVTHEFDETQVDSAVAACPNVPAVFLVWPREGSPYLARTALLHRRLMRLLAPRGHASRLLHLRPVARRIEYWICGSRLESSLLLYSLARRYFPQDYARILKLRQSSYVKLILSNPFPRTQVTTRLSGADSLHYGPFSSRAAAENFENGFLDFFQLRRCQEDLQPSSDHPGCVYGEMNKCLRPCQRIVSVEEYASEAGRVAGFLRSDGVTLLDSLRAARDRWSEELQFEEAARMHKRIEKAAAILQLRGELATDIQRLCGVAVTPAADGDAVGLWFLLDGSWRHGHSLSLRVEEGRPIPLDRRLKELASALPAVPRAPLRERQDHLSLLAAWFYSSWRDGEWVPFSEPAAIPYRKLVNAIHRVARSRSTT